jgi:hypothetical protein
MRLMQLTAHMKQRRLESALGVSLGKTNSSLKALLATGWLKIQNFKCKKDDLANVYLFTPQSTKKTLLA